MVLSRWGRAALAVVVVAGVLVGVPTVAQASASRVISIVDAAGDPVAYASVTVAHDPVVAGATGEDGLFTAVAVDSGDSVRVSAPGYATATGTIAGSGTTTITLTLAGGIAPQEVYGFPAYNAVLEPDTGSPDTFYAQSGYGSGVWRTTDAGTSWSPVTTESMDPVHGLVGEAHYTGEVVVTSGVGGEVAVATAVPGGFGECLRISASSDYGSTWKEVPFDTVGCISGVPELHWGHADGGASILLVRLKYGGALYLADMTAGSPELVQDSTLALGASDLLQVAVDKDGPFAVVAPKGGSGTTSTLTIHRLSAAGAALEATISLGASIEVSDGTFPLRIGGQSGSVIALGDGSGWAGVDTKTGVIAMAAKASTGAWTTTRVGVFDTVTACYAHEVVLAPVGDIDGGIIGMSPGCAFTVEAGSGDTDLAISTSPSDHGLRPAYSSAYGMGGDVAVVAVSFSGGSRGLVRFTSADAANDEAPGTVTDATAGIRDTVVAATVPGPDDSTVVVLEESPWMQGGNQVIATYADGTVEHVMRYYGGTSASAWQGSTTSWIAVGHNQDPVSLIAGWGKGDGPVDFFAGARVDPTASNITGVRVGGGAAVVTALEGVPAQDEVFLGTFAGTGAANYAGKVFWGEIDPLDISVDLTELAFPAGDPTAMVQDIAYCGTGPEVDPSVTDTLFVATGYLNWAPGGLYRAEGVRAALVSDTPVTLTRISGVNDENANVVVPDVAVDCSIGMAVTVDPSGGDAVVSDDGFDTSYDVALGDQDPGVGGVQEVSVQQVDIAEDGSGAIILGGNVGSDEGYVFELDYYTDLPMSDVNTPDIEKLYDPAEENLPLLIEDLSIDSGGAAGMLPRGRVKSRSGAASTVGVMGTKSGSFAVSGTRASRANPGFTAPSLSGLSAVAGDARVKVSWSAPSSGGTSLQKIVVTAARASDGGGKKSCTWTTGSRTCTITGLVNGTAYKVSAKATNAAQLSSAVVSPSGNPSYTPRALAVALASPSAGTLRATLTPGAPDAGSFKAQLQVMQGVRWVNSGSAVTVSGGTASWTGVASGRYRVSVAAVGLFSASLSSELVYTAPAVAVAAVKSGKSVTVTVTPTPAVTGTWTVVLQKWTSGSWKKQSQKTTTKVGPKQSTTFTGLTAGKYRAVVDTARGYAGGTSGEVTIT